MGRWKNQQSICLDGERCEEGRSNDKPWCRQLRAFTGGVLPVASSAGTSSNVAATGASAVGLGCWQIRAFTGGVLPVAISAGTSSNVAAAGASAVAPWCRKISIAAGQCNAAGAKANGGGDGKTSQAAAAAASGQYAS